MRLLTHNTLCNNAASAKGKGFPLVIQVAEIRIENDNGVDERQQIEFVKGVLPSLDWPALVQAATAMGIPTLPPTLPDELTKDDEFLKALYHILMNVHLVKGKLICPATGREFLVENEIANMILEEEDCEAGRF